VYDKTVRRRRVVLGLLVASSLILLTAYFGESAGGGLHSIQRGTLEVVSPIQEGASRALKPVRDLFGWAGDTFHAKGQLKDVRKDRDALRAQNIQLQAKLREQGQLGDQIALNKQHDLTDNGPVSAHVIGQDPNLWFTQVNIDRGTSSGVHENQAVVNGEGLVGKVTAVTAGTAIVTLATDHTTQIGATVSESGVKGIVGVEAGHPTELVLTALSGKDPVRRGETVVTSGTVSNLGKFPSPYPRDIPIGRVTRVDAPGSDNQQVHVAPFANARRLDLVEVLTKGDVAAR
jgi:rod shape-determining protein MreC